MKEQEVRQIFKKFSPKNITLLNLSRDANGDFIIHAEIHNDSGIIWKRTRESRQKVRNAKTSDYGKSRKFSLKRRDSDLLAMEHSRIET
jgi:hypothetical protein